MHLTSYWQLPYGIAQLVLIGCLTGFFMGTHRFPRWLLAMGATAGAVWTTTGLLWISPKTSAYGAMCLTIGTITLSLIVGYISQRWDRAESEAS